MAGVAAGLIAGKPAWSPNLALQARQTAGPFTFEYVVEQPSRPTMEGDVVRVPASLVVPAADAVRARGGRGSDRRADHNGPGAMELRSRGGSDDCLRPHQHERRALLRPGDCAAKRLPARFLQGRRVHAETARWRSSAPGPDRSEVARWQPDERRTAVLLAGHRRLSVAAKAGKRDRLLPLAALGRT